MQLASTDRVRLYSMNVDYTYAVVETTSDSLASNPNLPLARLTIPRCTLVVPTSIPEWIIETVQRLPVDRHRNEAGFWCVRNPRLDFSIFAGHWNDCWSLFFNRSIIHHFLLNSNITTWEQRVGFWV